MYRTGSGFSGDSQLLCRQPKNMIIHNRTFDGMYRGRKDTRWQKLVTSYQSTNSQFVAAKISDVVQLDVDEFHKVTLRNQKSVTCTRGQQFRTREGYKSVEELKEGDCIGLMRSKLVWFSVIDKIEILSATDQKAYAIVVDDQEEIESIIVNGIIAKI